MADYQSVMGTSATMGASKSRSPKPHSPKIHAESAQVGHRAVTLKGNRVRFRWKFDQALSPVDGGDKPLD